MSIWPHLALCNACTSTWLEQYVQHHRALQDNVSPMMMYRK